MPLWDARYNRITDIDPRTLSLGGIALVLLDVDNTLTTHDNPVPMNGITDWLKRLEESGIKAVIVSNNSYDRVRPFADLLGLEFIPDAKKPLPFVMRQLLSRYCVLARQAAVVGDQLFTDMLGGRLLGAVCILTEPIALETGRFFRFKRACERRIFGRNSHRG